MLVSEYNQQVGALMLMEIAARFEVVAGLAVLGDHTMPIMEDNQ
jgi:hypothetical protein